MLPAKAVVATDSASADADHDNGTTLHGRDRWRRGRGVASDRLDTEQGGANYPGRTSSIHRNELLCTLRLTHPLNRTLLIFSITLGRGAQLITVLLFAYAITTDNHAIGRVGLR
jgi:hypothetical protein